MRSGRLRHRVTLQRQDTAPRDAHGGLPLVWTALGSRSCEIADQGGGERNQTSGETSEITANILMRRDSLTKTLTPADRLLDERQSPAVAYEIIRCLARNRDRDLLILCKRDG